MNISEAEPSTTSLSEASPAALKVGDVVEDGPNKGWIYCETKKGHGFLVAPKDSGVMKWRAAMRFAASEKSELPTRDQLDAIYDARNTGALKGTFNLTGPHDDGWYWSATQLGYVTPCCQRFSDGKQHVEDKPGRLSVRRVRELSII